MYIDQSSKNLNQLFLKTIHESLTLKVKRVLILRVVIPISLSSI